MKRVSLFVVMMLAARVADACDLCALYAAQDAESGSGWRAGLFGQYSHATTLLQEGDEIHNEGDEQLDSFASQLIAGYRFNDVWGLQLNVPLLRREFDRPGEDEGTRDDGAESGLGDIALIASARLAHFGGAKQHLALHAIGGIKLPTGDSDWLAEEEAHGEVHIHEDGSEHVHEADAEEHGHAGGLHDHDLALGSGSVDGILGLTLSGASDRWFIRGQSLYLIRSEGDHDYTYADDVTWSLLPGYTLWLSEGGSLGLGLNVNGEHKGKDTRGDEKEEDTALDAIYAGPGVSFTAGETTSGELALDLPIKVDNSGTQLTPDYRIRVSVTARF